MNLLFFKTNEDLNKSGAGIIISLIQSQPRTVLGLATGSSPIGIYQEMIHAYQKELVSFQNTTTFNLDEYMGLPKNHEQSYHTYMEKQLFSHIDLPKEQAFLPDSNAVDLEQECKNYDEKISNANGIDLQILGIGHNGHIGFNEPGESLQSNTHVVQLDEKTRTANARFFNSIDEVPTHAITMGVGSILKAKMVMLIVRGADKAEIVHRALTGEITTQCPASLLQTHPRLMVLMDQEAGRLFKRS